MGRKEGCGLAHVRVRRTQPSQNVPAFKKGTYDHVGMFQVQNGKKVQCGDPIFKPRRGKRTKFAFIEEGRSTGCRNRGVQKNEVDEGREVQEEGKTKKGTQIKARSSSFLPPEPGACSGGMVKGMKGLIRAHRKHIGTKEAKGKLDLFYEKRLWALGNATRIANFCSFRNHSERNICWNGTNTRKNGQERGGRVRGNLLAGKNGARRTGMSRIETRQK